MITITPELPADSAAIENLLDDAFGRDRMEKKSYSFRHGVERLWPLCVAAREAGRVVGTARAWPVRIGSSEHHGILVGPVAVAAGLRKQGLGARLLGETLNRARDAGVGAAVLVGDIGYYGRFGFVAADRFGIVMPKENAARTLALPLLPECAMPHGEITRWRSVRGLSAAA